MRLDTFVSLVAETDRITQLWEHALDFLHTRGIQMVSYHSDDAQRPGGAPLKIVADGFPDKWVCHYIEAELIKVDPIPRLAADLGTPFYWSQVSDLMRLTEAERAYIEKLQASGLGDGLAIEVFGPDLRNAYVGLGFGSNAHDLSAQDVFELQSAMQIAHVRYCQISDSRATHVDALSGREREVLEWVAKGKSNSVIADILGISRHSVDTLLRRVYEKLDVNDRTTAAIRGIGSGVLHVRGGDVT